MKESRSRESEDHKVRFRRNGPMLANVMRYYTAAARQDKNRNWSNMEKKLENATIGNYPRKFTSQNRSSSDGQ